MSTEPNDKVDPKLDPEQASQANSNESEWPDGRGPRPTNPNELAKWIVDQTTEDAPAEGTTARSRKSPPAH